MLKILTLVLGLAGFSQTPTDKSKPTAPAPTLTVDDVVARVKTVYSKVTDFKASFKQVVKRKHLPRPRKSRGKVFFKAPNMMRWDYLAPEKVYYISDGKVLWSYQPEDKIAYRMSVKKSELYSALKFLFGQGDLKKEFKVKLGKPSKGLIELRLKPKKRQTNYKRLALFVDAKTFQIRKTQIVDPLGNLSTVTFSKPEYKPLNAKAFGFKPPKGVKVEDLTGTRKRSTRPVKPAPAMKPAPKTGEKKE